ncbi:hypothetical protein BDN70DRAFT_883709 [Pholiota conissans]|uniref:Uncharacterized protein n=1 Tax=Pholiota conissans TaxID=109636 RepID=A0A9P5YU14_9AGAR|nr:hypothetical protein BDN70DRAFT_883709 [Pholiota conissans]
MSAPSFGSRFHAIVAAKSVDGTGPPIIPPQQYPAYQHNPYEPWRVRFEDTEKKRRRESNAEAGPSNIARKTVKRSTDEEGFSSREPTKVYQSRDELLLALRDRFRHDSNVDFHGTYDMVDSEVTHKQRVQSIAHDIWKATGYRFTVKDHPQFINGHKTRFWCSQDEAHRSKSSRAARKLQGDCYKPRVTSAGEVMAKSRYPCRSRLLISSRDARSPGTRCITVRMHHHVSHEPYVDANLPPEVVQRIWESFGWVDQQGTGVEPTSAANGDTTMQPPISDNGMGDEEDSDVEREDDPIGAGYEAMDDDIPKEPPPPPPPLPASAQDYTPDPPINLEYRHRMEAHIKNLREFCDGLEYQLQFNDYRMLEMLEREGGSFLGLVEDCLQKEGRMVPVVPPPISQPSNGQIPASRPPHSIPMASINPIRPYEGNPGINPRALDY